MKTTISTSSPVPVKTIKQGPLQRLSLAVKKLDQLINRANQLGELPLQVFNKDKIRKTYSTFRNQSNPTHFF